MNMLVRTFFENGGIACARSSLQDGYDALFFGEFVGNFLENMQSLQGRNVFLLHPLRFSIEGVKQFVYEVGVEEAVVALLAYGLSAFGSKGLRDFAAALDVGYLASECNFCEEELEEIAQNYKEHGLVLYIGPDLIWHQSVVNLARILALLSVSLERLQCVFLPSVFSSSKMHNIPLNFSVIEPLGELRSYDGLIAYVQEGKKQENLLEASKQFCLVGRVQEGDMVKIVLESKIEVLAKIRCNLAIKGMVGVLWSLDKVLHQEFCYQSISLSKVES